MTRRKCVGVAGAGAWGIALANAAAAAGRQVVLWGRDATAMRSAEATRLSPKLPGVRLLDSVVATSDLGLLAQADAILVAVPAQATRAAASALAALPGSAPLVACAKGVETAPGGRLGDAFPAIRGRRHGHDNCRRLSGGRRAG